MSTSWVEELLARLDALGGRLSERHRTIGAVLARGGDRHRSVLRRVDAVIDKRQHQLASLHAQIQDLRRTLRREASLHRRLEKQRPSHVRTKARVLERLRRIARSGKPIIVGPWTGEIGYELLYWIPFVRWFAAEFAIDPARLCLISRGGPLSWYSGLGASYLDALSVLSPAEFQQGLRSLGWMKQSAVTPLDREILRRVRRPAGERGAAILHPLLMFRLLKGYWGGRLSLNDVLMRTSHQRIPPPPRLPGLPARYVAARFYFRDSFPDTEGNRRFVARVLASLTRQHDVVILNPGFTVDDHRDYAAARSERVHTLDHVMTPDTNLEVQTAAIAHADAFVGSYGGLSYLAPLLGVRSIAFYSNRAFKTSHLELAEHVFRSLDGASLTTLAVSDMSLLASTRPGVAASIP